MNKQEKAVQLLERAERLGLTFAFDGGLNTVKQAKSGDRNRQDDALRELGQYVGEIRLLLQQRAVGARAKELIGRRIWCGQGQGVLASADSDGTLSITITKEDLRKPSTFTYNAETLLVVLDEEATDGAASSGNEEAERPAGFFDRLRSSSRRD